MRSGNSLNNIMEHNGFKASIMEAERLTGENEHALPPGSALPVYKVLEFKKHPNHWMKEEGCYVVPVKPNKGLWFDWTMNDSLNTAVVPTVKGCNPITGLKTDKLNLERYKNKCPKHNIKFMSERYCEKCGYKWPSQNYISSPNILWWDGFRNTDGNVRQFFITEDMIRDVASHMIGKENTVPAFGFSFFNPKEKRMHPNNFFRGLITTPNPMTPFPFSDNDFYTEWNNPVKDNFWDVNKFEDNTYYSNNLFYCSNSAGKLNIGDLSPSIFNNSNIDNISSNEKSYTSNNVNLSSIKSRSIQNKEVAVGAGAKIKQEITTDTYELSSWKDTPDAIMRIYFVFQDEFEHWKSFGLRDLDGKKDGMLNGLPVG